MNTCKWVWALSLMTNFRSNKKGLEFHKVYGKHTHYYRPFCRSYPTKWLIMSALSNMQNVSCLSKFSFFFVRYHEENYHPRNLTLDVDIVYLLVLMQPAKANKFYWLSPEANWIDKKTNTKHLSLKGVGLIFYTALWLKINIE